MGVILLGPHQTNKPIKFGGGGGGLYRPLLVKNDFFYFVENKILSKVQKQYNCF